MTPTDRPSRTLSCSACYQGDHDRCELGGCLCRNSGHPDPHPSLRPPTGWDSDTARLASTRVRVSAWLTAERILATAKDLSRTERACHKAAAEAYSNVLAALNGVDRTPSEQ